MVSYINVGLALNFSGHHYDEECVLGNNRDDSSFWNTIIFLYIREGVGASERQ